MKKTLILSIVLILIGLGSFAQWVPLSSGTSNNISALAFTSATAGYAVCDAGIILKTTNGGQSWTQLPSVTSSNLWSVSFPTADTGYVVGENGTVL